MQERFCGIGQPRCEDQWLNGGGGGPFDVLLCYEGWMTVSNGMIPSLVYDLCMNSGLGYDMLFALVFNLLYSYYYFVVMWLNFGVKANHYIQDL